VAIAIATGLAEVYIEPSIVIELQNTHTSCRRRGTEYGHMKWRRGVEQSEETCSLLIGLMEMADLATRREHLRRIPH